MEKDKLKKNEKIDEKEEPIDENIAYKITFRRLNKISLITGFCFFILVIINIPFLYNPELDAITFELLGKPTMGPMAAFRAYLWTGLIPLLFGIIFILFSILSSRSINLIIYLDGKVRYVKKGVSNFILDTQVDFIITDKLQRISLGQRHQRFVIWVPIAIIIFIIHILIDYINFLNFSFDITFFFYDMELSLKMMLLINIVLMTAIIIPYTLFPRKLCRIDTSEEFIQFDYSKLELETMQEKIEDFPFIKAIEFLSLQKNERKDEKKEPAITADIFPEVLKEQAKKGKFKHFPLFSLVMNIAFLILILIPLFIPNFFLGGFTFRIEYFLTIATFYFIVRTLQKNWFKEQLASEENNGKDLLIKRENRIFGNSVKYFTDIDIIEQDYSPHKPHYLEYVLLFFPLWQAVWIIMNISTFAEYFFLENYYTSIYLTIIVGIFFFTAAEYLFPKSILSITPKAQSEDKQKAEKFSIFFPSKEIERFPPFGAARSSPNNFKNSIEGIILILVPLIFGSIWIILSAYEIVPPLFETIF